MPTTDSCHSLKTGKGRKLDHLKTERIWDQHTQGAVFSVSSGSRPSVCVCVLISSYRDTSHVGLFWILFSH